MATDTNPIESIEEEPKKPTLSSVSGGAGAAGAQAPSNPEFEREKERISNEIDKQQSFMLHLMYMSRDNNLTNDPIELFKQYRE